MPDAPWNWSLDLAAAGSALKTTRFTEVTGGGGYSATVSAMSRALAAFSRDVTKALAALPK